MVEMHPLLLLFMAELLFLTTAGMIVMLVMGMIRKKRDRAAARALIERIKSDEERRKQETREILEERYGIDGESLESSMVLIDHGEKFLYQNMINTYLNRDADALQNFAVDYESSVAAYRDLQIPKGKVKVVHKEVEGSAAQEVTEQHLEELEVLRKENARLSDELKITMDTMSRMLNEYASMYGGGTGADLDKEKMLKMFQAEREEEEAKAAASIKMEDGELRVVDHETGEEAAPEEIAEAEVAEEEIPEPEDLSEPELDLLVEEESVEEASGLDDVDWDEVEQDILETQPETEAAVEVPPEEATEAAGEEAAPPESEEAAEPTVIEEPTVVEEPEQVSEIEEPT
ncbi:MAG: hypothetical protein ABW066_14170, partial [Sedimenticola sp.]